MFSPVRKMKMRKTMPFAYMIAWRAEGQQRR